ncbi:hypothetical protein BGX24_004748 [Mortierella sp. AD032]|nr:hypothetical protein BGX24_004748 [Mortierella sp. AD032]
MTALVNMLLMRETLFLKNMKIQLNPAGGVGCQNAMHDAIVLANWINALPSDPTTEDIENAFKSYKDERIPWVRFAFNSTRFYRTMASSDKGSVPPAFQPSLLAIKPTNL